MAKEQKEGSVKDPDVVYIVMKDDTDYDGKYTNAKSGQQALGGYTDDGYKVYAKWLALNKLNSSFLSDGIQDRSTTYNDKQHNIKYYYLLCPIRHT